MSEIKEQNTNICSKCGAVLKDDEKQPWQGADGNPVYYCANCVTSINQEYHNQTLNPNVFLGLLFGVGASIVAGFIWYFITNLTHTMYDIIVIAVGFCIAYATSKGAGNKKGWKIQLISVLLTLITFIIADGMYAISQIASHYGFSTLEYITKAGMILGPIVHLLIFPKYVIASASFTSVIFWLIGMYIAFVYAAPEKLNEYKQKQ